MKPLALATWAVTLEGAVTQIRALQGEGDSGDRLHLITYYL
jgi:hypothetical protein